MSCLSNTKYEMKAPVKRWTPLFLVAVFGACVSASAETDAGARAMQQGAHAGSPRSVAGALHLPGRPGKRGVYDMNVGRRFYKGAEAPEGVYSRDFNDIAWQRANLPQKPVSGSLRFETQSDGLIKLFDEDAVGRATGDAEREFSDRGPASEKERNLRDELEKTRAELNRLRNEQVGRQQTHFE